MLLLDGQVHHDTHAVPMGNYVIEVGNYVIASPSELGNYMIADIAARFASLVIEDTKPEVKRRPSRKEVRIKRKFIAGSALETAWAIGGAAVAGSLPSLPESTESAGCPARRDGTGRQAARPARARPGAAARSADALIQERPNSATVQDDTHDASAGVSPGAG